MRDRLVTPVPKILAWSATSDENPVGAEYIIMEGLHGVTLAEIWRQLRMDDRLEVMKQIAEHQKSWMACSFKSYGSLYFKESLESWKSPMSGLDDASSQVVDAAYEIGPSVDRALFDHGRSTLSLDRGPCESGSNGLSSRLTSNRE